MRFAQANMIRQNAPTEKREILEGIGVQQGGVEGCRSCSALCPCPDAESHYLYELLSGSDGFAWGYGKIRDPACNMHEIGTEENAIEI